MMFEPSVIITRDSIVAAAAPFAFSAYVDEHNWRDDGHDLERIVISLSTDIRGASPALQPVAETYGDALGITPKEYEYSANFWYLWHLSPIITVIQNEGWSLRRVHIEMVDMLRALIALDPEKLRQYDIIDTTDVVRQVEKGSATAGDTVPTELERLSRDDSDGHMFRYGLYLGMKLAMAGKAHPELTERLLRELGAQDPMHRPDYPTGERTAKFSAEIAARKRKSTSGDA